MKAASLAGLAATSGSVQTSANPDVHSSYEVADLPDGVSITSVIPHPKVGPVVTDDDHYFAGPGWGVRFAVDGPAHIASAVVDSETSGSITATLHAFDADAGASAGVVAEQEVTLNKGVQRITLDMVVPEAGEYLLTHHDDHALRVLDWKEWGRQGGVDLIGAHHVDSDRSPVNDEWYYYFFDLEIATANFQLQSRQISGAVTTDTDSESDANGEVAPVPKLYDMRAIVDEAGRSDGEPVDDLLRSAYREATRHDVILFRDGRYRIEEDHYIPTALTLRGQNAVLDMASDVWFGFRGSYHNYGPDEPAVTEPDGSVRKGARAINTTGTNGFSPGDYIVIETPDRRPLRTGDSYKCQIMRIERISGTWLTLEQSTQTRFPAGCRIVKINPVEGPVFKDLHIEGGGIPLQMESCVNGRFENCHVEGYARYANRICYSLGTVVDNTTALNPTTRSGGHGEAILTAYSTNTTINHPRAHKCRRGIDFFHGVYGVQVNNPYVTGVTMHGICNHGPSPCGNIVVNGGVFESDSLDGDSDEYYWGNGTSFDEYCESIKIHGTTFRNTRSAISDSSQALTAQGIVIESIYKEVGSGSNTLSDTPIGIRFSGEKCHITGIYNDEHGQFSRRTSTSGADHAHIDLV